MTEPALISAAPPWDVADRMRKSLRHADIGVQEMAVYLGVARNTVSTWINGRIDPSTQTLRLWALRCGVPYDWLQNGGPEPEPDVSAGERPFRDMCRSTWTCGPPELDAA